MSMDGQESPWAFERETAVTLERLEIERVKSLKRIEEERVQTEKRALERQERERQELKPKGLQKPRTAEEARLHKMRVEYKRMGIKVDF